MALIERPERDTDPLVDGQSASPRRGIWRSGWWPASLVVALSAAVLHYYDVPLRTFAMFGGYLATCIVLPGLLVWRWVHRGSRWFVEDVAAGTAVGYAIEVLTYIPMRALGVPLLVLASPVLIIAIFLAVPGLRKYWRAAGDAGQVPLLWSWTMSGVACMLVMWSTKYYRYHGMSWPSYGRPDIDMPFHLALVGEFKHHMDLVTPWVTSEPVLYHWFVYADMAATSWVTGIEPFLLVTRLSVLPMIIMFALLMAVIARRLTGGWWSGPAAAVGTFFVLAPNPYGWELVKFFSDWGFNTVDDGSFFRLNLWTSPTQTFGSLLFAPVVLMLIDFFRGSERDVRQWGLLIVLPCAVMGAKATYLPMLLAALLLIVATHLVFRRRLHRVALAATGITFVYLLIAQFILFGGASQGLTLAPLAVMERNSAGFTTSFTSDPKMWRLVVLALLTVLCWACNWAFLAGVRRRLLDPAVLLLLGLGLAGIGGILLTGHTGGSEMYFLQSARPYLSLAAVYGISLLVPVMTRRTARALLLSVIGGAILIRLIRFLSGPGVPYLAANRRPAMVAFDLAWPYAVLVAVATAFGIAVWANRRRLGAGMPVAMTAALLIGFSLPTAYSQVDRMIRDGQMLGWRERAELWPTVTQGTVEAGRWLRDHSSPQDLVATNAHCVILSDSPKCDHRHFGIAAYSERWVLLEGWAYTAAAHDEEVHGVPQEYVSYWKPQIQADNDAAFEHPSAATIGKLRDEYGVRWLFVEDNRTKPSPDLGKFATLRYRSGHCAVYQIR